MAVLFLTCSSQMHISSCIATEFDVNYTASFFSVDSEAVLSRQQAMDEARRHMQEQFDAQAARHAEEVKKVCNVEIG